MLTAQPLWASLVLGAKRRGIALHMHGFDYDFFLAQDKAQPQCWRQPVLTLGFVKHPNINFANLQIFKCILNLFFYLFIFIWSFYFLFFSELITSMEPQTSVAAEGRDAILNMDTHSSIGKGLAETERTGIAWATLALICLMLGSLSLSLILLDWRQ